MSKAVDEPLAFAPDDEAAWQRLALGYRLAGLLVSAHRLGLLARLTDGQTTLEVLAAELQADPALLAQMCRALGVAGLLRESNGGWCLSASGERLAADPAAAAELDSLILDYQRWGALDEHAHSAVDAHSDPAGDDVDSAHRYALRLAARHRGHAVAMLDRVEPTRQLTVMDVGGADGFLAREVCARWPDARCIVLEQPAMAEVARATCAGDPRIRVIEGSFLGEHGPTEALPAEADVVVLSHVLQGGQQAQQRNLTARAAAALRPGGCLLSCESVLRSDQKGPLETVLWAVGEAAQRRAGHILTTIDQDVLLRAAGLAASAAWWVSDSTRAVLGVRTDVGVKPALRMAT